MIYKNLGHTDITVPAIAQGTTRMGTHQSHDPSMVKNRIDLLKEAIHLGSNLIDTAELYGNGFAEEVVGRAISGVRERVILASKFNPKESVAKGVNKSIENSLRRLKTDRIDLYQIHWPNPSIPIEQLMSALSRLVDQGKVRYVGLSNFSLDGWKIAQSVFDKQLVSNQVEYNLLDRSAEDAMIPYCMDNGLTFLAYGVFNQGHVSVCRSHEALLIPMAEKYGKTVHQIVLRWLIRQAPVTVITKTESLARLRENIGASEFDLEDTDLEAIMNLSREKYDMVPLSRIRLNHHDPRVYSTLDAALENPLDLIPSPTNLARLILEQGILKPIRLRPLADNGAYELDSYDLTDQVKKYWAWTIAYGADASIPAFVGDVHRVNR
jgi:aryl-alcohol dehydrogenase-like predicted oxidoreductase